MHSFSHFSTAAHHRIWNIAPCALQQDLVVQRWLFMGGTPAPLGCPSLASCLWCRAFTLPHPLSTPGCGTSWVPLLRALVGFGQQRAWWGRPGVGRSDIILLTSPPPQRGHYAPRDSCLCLSIKCPCPLKAAESSPRLFKACPLWGVLVTRGTGVPTIPTDWNRRLGRLPGGPQPSCLLLCFLSALFGLRTAVDRPSATKPSSIQPTESLWVFSSPHLRLCLQPLSN